MAVQIEKGGCLSSAQPASSNRRLLVLSFFPAFSPPRSGGELRLFHLYRELSRTFDVVLLSSSHLGGAEQVVQHAPRFRERRIPKDGPFAEAWERISKISGPGDISGPCVGLAASSPTAFHMAYLEEYEAADLIIHDSPFTIGYDLFAGVDDKPRVYNAYNCETDLYQNMHPGEPSQAIPKIVEELERRLLSVSDQLWYCGEGDLLAFKRMLGSTMPQAIYVPNCAAVQSTPEREKRTGAITDAFFIGSAHLPNVEAAGFIVQTLAPSVPNVRFHIVGNCLKEGNYPPNVVRHGVVADAEKARIMQRADIALNPIMSGSGSNLKIFDFLQQGLPVLSTRFGVRGIEVEHGVHCLIADPDQFARVLTGHQPARTKLEAIGVAGRRLVTERYSWRHTADQTALALKTLRPQAPRLMDAPYVLALNDYDSFASTGGGATRTRALYEKVSLETSVVFLCLTGETRLAPRSSGERIFVLPVPKSASHRAREAELNGRHYVSVDDIIAVEQAPRNELLVALYAILRKRARIVVTEHPYMCVLPRQFEDPFVYSSQNCELSLKRDLLATHPDRDELVALLQAAEDFAVEASSLVIAVSDEDAMAFVQGRAQAPPVLIVRNGAMAPTRSAAVELGANRVGPMSAVFLGSAHIPNVEAATFIVCELAPQCPEVTFHFVGSVCSALPAERPSNIVTWGRVDDGTKSAILETAAVALNPMFSGSGSNVKLADYLAHGLAVVTTAFGVRGYSPEVVEHVAIADRTNFAEALKALLGDSRQCTPALRLKRQKLFETFCSMTAIAETFKTALQDLDTPRRRALFVTYRYSWPTLGGAEAMTASLLQGLCRSGRFSVDVAAVDVAAIENVERFGSHYQPVSRHGAMIDVPNLRYMRFPSTPIDTKEERSALLAIWAQQPIFERELYGQLRTTLKKSGLAWGWDYPEAGGRHRGAMRFAGLHLVEPAEVTIEGTAPKPGNVMIELDDRTIAIHEAMSGAFCYRFTAPPGTVSLTFALDEHITDHVRPLGASISMIRIGNEVLDLTSPPVFSASNIRPHEAFDMLANAAEVSRNRAGVRLTDVRGPQSDQLDQFLDMAVSEYDLVITHNCVFRTSAAAIHAAHRHGVPVISIPHAHFDDDYYHFPDMTESYEQSTAILAAPKAACDFLRRRCKTPIGYLPAGIDTSERFSADDVTAFRAVSRIEHPYVLVLGRKAGAKNYQLVIDAVRSHPRLRKVHVVMIGPDDDGVPLKDPGVTYLGLQPRNVVRGALQSSLALVNMSTSESFGIVLLESWLAGRPVIANVDCAAFHDLAVHEQNALLVAPQDLAAAIARLATDAKLGTDLAANGRQTAALYDWSKVNEHFVKVCLAIAQNDQSPQSRQLDF